MAGQISIISVSTVLFPCSKTSNFFLLRFSLGPAVLESEFRADHESGLRIEQSPAGHIESSVLKSAEFLRNPPQMLEIGPEMKRFLKVHPIPALHWG